MFDRAAKSTWLKINTDVIASSDKLGAEGDVVLNATDQSPLMAVGTDLADPDPAADDPQSDDPEGAR